MKYLIAQRIALHVLWGMVILFTTVLRKPQFSGLGFRLLNTAKKRNSFQVLSRVLKMNSMKGKDYYVTTPIYYVNGLPHLGHAYTSVISDIVARFQRSDGARVQFLTGTDEHGQKVEQSATKNGKTALAFADEVSDKFRHLVTTLDCSHDDFIRTTEDRHKLAVSDLWKRLESNNQIYLGAYEGWYSIRDEAFYGEDELVDGKAPTGAEVEWVREESYFFRLSEWTDKLLDFYDANPEFIAPKGRRNEVVSFVGQEGGLKDLSISRTTFSWGIPVPSDPKHVVYVWLDALTNYLSAIGYPDTDSALFKAMWPAALHVVGKDILRFHAIFWPAFLMAAGLETPKRIFAHGWWTRDGEKMSKSVGNVLDPFELIEAYGVEYVRYYLAAEIHFGNDGDFSHEAFCARINSDLCNDLGNLAQRTLTMVNKHCGGKVPDPGEHYTEEDRVLLEALQDALPTTRAHVQTQGIKHMCDTIISLSKLGNKYIDTQAPWVLVKTDKDRMNTVLYVLTELIRTTAILLQPVMPNACTEMLRQLGVPNSAEARSFAALANPIPPGTTINAPTPIFPKLDLAEIQTKFAASSSNQPAGNGTGSERDEPFRKYVSFNLVQLANSIGEVGDAIRTQKAAKASKEELKPLIDELLFLKDAYKEKNGGVAYDPKVKAA